MTENQPNAELPAPAPKQRRARAPHAASHRLPIQLPFLEQIKRRNVGRVAILYLVVGYLVLETFGVFFHLLAMPEWVGRAMVVVVALGFPVALLFAWAYEITPEGIKPTAEVPPTQSVARHTGRRLDRAIIMMLAVALSYFVVDKFWLSKRVAAPAAAAPVVSLDKSIAVLPFVDMSEKKDQEYFADGMAEEIINLLVTIPDLKVIGRTSSFQFKDKTDDLRRIGAALGAAYIVEGSVRRSGDHIRVTAQLIGARDGAHRWSETYDREASDVLKVQAQIATSLVRALQLEVMPSVAVGAQQSLSNDEAYEVYLRGRHAMERRDQAGIEEAVSDFQHALELDPTFSAAASGLAVARVNLAYWGYAPPREGFERARVAAEAALKLDPKSALAHGVLCAVFTEYDWDWPAAERETRIIVALAPKNPPTLLYASDERMAVGQLAEARQFLNTAISADPLDAELFLERSWVYLREDRLAEAENDSRRVLQISPTFASSHYWLGVILLIEGRNEEALTEIQKEQHSGMRLAGLAAVLPALHRTKEADAVLARLKSEHAGDFAMGIAEAHAVRGERDQAFAWLDRAYAQKDFNLYYIKGDPLLKNLEQDARYRAFLRKMKLPET